MWSFSVDAKCLWFLQDIIQTKHDGIMYSSIYSLILNQVEQTWLKHGGVWQQCSNVPACGFIQRSPAGTLETQRTSMSRQLIYPRLVSDDYYSVFQVLSQVLVNGFYWNLCQSPELSLPIPDSTAERRALPRQYMIGLHWLNAQSSLPSVSTPTDIPEQASCPCRRLLPPAGQLLHPLLWRNDGQSV